MILHIQVLWKPFFVDSNFQEQAKAIFSDLKINVVTGFKFIGGFIGSGNDIEKWLIEKVQKRVSCVHSLASAAEEFPHSAHTVLTKSLPHEWGYIMLGGSGVENYLNPSRDFLSNLTALDKKK